MEELVKALAIEFALLAPEIEASPRISLYRIHRDTRFSRNKSPYKTYVAAVFPTRGLPKHESAGLYFHISPDELLIGGGLYMPFPEDLRSIRSAIAGNYQEFQLILRNRHFKRIFGELSGQTLARVPRGFPADHPAEAHLKLKQYIAGRRLSPELASSSEFRKILLETFKAVLPLLRFLNRPIRERKRTSAREEALLL